MENCEPSSPVGQAHSSLTSEVALAGGMVIREQAANPVSPGLPLDLTRYRSVCSDRIDLALGDQTFEADNEIRVYGPDVVKMSFVQKGWFDLTFDTEKIQESMDGRCLLITQPEGVPKMQRNRRGDHHRCVTLIFSPQFILETIPSTNGLVAAPLHTIASGRVEDLHIESHVMTSEMHGCVSKLVDCAMDDPLSELLMESKSLELLYLFMQLLRDTHCPRTPSEKLSIAERVHLDDAREVLHRDFAAPPRLETLGRIAGMSRTKLAAAFKRQYGMTVGDYCLMLRMEAARKLLRTTRQPISEIAFDVGYEHQSSFGSAYRLYFGVTPRIDRLHTMGTS